MNVCKFQVDFYPYHLAKANRRHWPKYTEASFPHTQWQEQALTQFKNKFFDLINKNRTCHTSLSRTVKVISNRFLYQYDIKNQEII